jgi:hypothetical protein
MQRKLIHTIFSAFLALLLMISAVAPDWIHQFSGHKDTHHERIDGLQFEQQHHHCAFLSFVPSLYVQHTVLEIRLTLPVYVSNYLSIATQCLAENIRVSEHLRGPPNLI